jgi:phosphoribosylformylglycinamidine cyclo-ligase
MPDSGSETYAGAGVDIEAGEKAVALIKEAVRSTYRSEVVGDIGGFGGLFALRAADYRQPVLVASTDGVGTKAMVATALGRYDSVGIDMVAMTVDDIACQGAEPLFVLDYLAVGKLEPDMAAALVEGVAEGCRQAGAALLGGEMAEHPGTMAPGEFDLSGTAVGVVERSAVLGPDRVRPGNALIGLASPGLRCNGLSLARRVYLEGAGRGWDDPAWEGAGVTVGEELLRASVIYSPALRALAGAIGPGLHAAAHITGGGIVGNVPRMLGADCDARIEWGTWVVPPVFAELARLGPIDPAEMARVFNLGLGMVAAVAPGSEDEALAALRGAGIGATLIGEVVAGEGRVSLEDWPA